MSGSVHDSGKTWAGFVVGAIGTIACPILIGLVLGSVDPPLQRRAYQQIRAAADVLAINEALAVFRADQGRYPTMAEGLAAMVPGQLDRTPIDPWGNAYAYSLANGIPDVVSYGADATPGGMDSAADISLETIDAIRSAHRRTIPMPIGLALIVAGALAVPALAFRMSGRSRFAVGVLSGAGFLVAFVSVLLGLTFDDAASAGIALLMGVLFACASMGVLVRASYSDSLVLTGVSLLGLAMWVWSQMITS